MPRVESTANVPVAPSVAFAVSQTYGPVRHRWDNFVRHQHLIGKAAIVAPGTRTFTRSKHGLRMISEYVTVKPPHHVGMRMVKGPWFFSSFSGGWHFTAGGDEPPETVVTWRYNFACRPRWLRWLINPIGIRVLQRDIDRRLAGFARGCLDPEVLRSTHPSS
jgi:hypothetical protein